MNYTTDNLDGLTSLISRGAGWAAETGMMIIVSAGNAGNSPWKLITPPADAIGVLSVGAISDQGLPAIFSSFGPTVDGRVKPEVVSFGVQTVLIRADGMLAVGNGTSFAAPIIAGFATLLWQQNPSLTSGALREYIISLSDRIENPDNQLGYGVPALRTITGINELSTTVKIYPVPVVPGDQVTIESSNLILEMRLYGINGRQKTCEYINEGKLAFIPTDELSGIYILHVITSSGKYTFKIVTK
jgi:serine protease AprX